MDRTQESFRFASVTAGDYLAFLLLQWPSSRVARLEKRYPALQGTPTRRDTERQEKQDVALGTSATSAH